MNFYGFIKTSLLDYPEHMASIVFTKGCNLRCPYCQNKDLILPGTSLTEYPEEEILAHLKKRKGLLDGLVVTGGEPTLHSELPEFLTRVKDLGYDIKLDTNGLRPEILKKLLNAGLLDYIAMDVKLPLSQYRSLRSTESLLKDKSLPGYDSHEASDSSLSSRLKESISLISKSTLPYEFRTTLCRELHSEESLKEMARDIPPDSTWYLQPFRDSEGVLETGYHTPSDEELTQYVNTLRPLIPGVTLRENLG